MSPFLSYTSELPLRKPTSFVSFECYGCDVSKVSGVLEREVIRADNRKTTQPII